MNTLPARTPHQFFSISRVWAISSNTLLELVRLKVFYFLLIFALVIIGVAGFSSVLELGFEEQFQIVKDVSLGAMEFFTVLLALLATANMLPKDIEDRTLYTILAKPVPRFEYLMGKLLGMFLLLLVSTLVMSAMFALALYTKQKFVTDATVLQYGDRPNMLAYTLKDLKLHTFTVSLIPCIVTIYIKAILLASLTMLISTFSSSYIFTLFISFTTYFIGSCEYMAREYLLTATSGAAVKIFLYVITLVFPDLHLFNLVDDIVAGNSIAWDLFLKTAGFGMTYVFVYSLVAYLIFSFKEL